jgi:hypothetical protein
MSQYGSQTAIETNSSSTDFPVLDPLKVLVLDYCR